MRLDDTLKFKRDLETKKESFWIKRGELMALNLFKRAARDVPAYKDFLKKNKVDPAKIKTIADFKNTPTISKVNYLKKYPFKDLCWHGNPGSPNMISVSSGSSGEPFYWPRWAESEKETSLLHELFLIDSFGIDKCSTLFITSFAMGVWVAGTLTYKCVDAFASKYNMTIITPGINGDVLKIIRSIGKNYDQIILAGYPPFVKDIIDEGERSGLNWKKYNLKFLFAAEAFSEPWRQYIFKKTGSKNYYKDSLNIYGTADALIMGHETPLSILVRKTAAESGNGLYKSIFKYDERVPSLVQYNPLFKYVEVKNGNLVFTYSGAMPLIRYDIDDTGDVIQYSKMKEILAGGGFDMEKEAKKKNISLWKLPFMYVYGRNDLTATFYGINIYPENIRDALNSRGVDKHVSGKFTMLTKNNKQLNQYLELNVELKNKATLGDGLVYKIKTEVVNALRNKNKEYNELYKALGPNAEPKIVLCQYGDREFFTPGVKQKWYRKA